jgi:hypothetical protein
MNVCSKNAVKAKPMLILDFVRTEMRVALRHRRLIRHPVFAALVLSLLGGLTNNQASVISVTLNGTNVNIADYRNPFAGKTQTSGATLVHVSLSAGIGVPGSTPTTDGGWGIISFYQCHPAKRDGVCWKGLHMSNLRNKNYVIDFDFDSHFFAARPVPNWPNARRKADFLSSHGLDSWRTISPLRQPLPRKLSNS